MAKKLYEEASVLAIANAIRAKNGSTATYKVAQMADAVLAIAPLQPDVEEYPQMSTTVAAYLTAAEAAYTDANGGSVSVLDSYTGASGIKDAPLGKALTMQGGTRYQQDETTGIGGKLNNILGGETVIYNAVPGHVLRYIVKGSGGDVIDSGRVKPTGTVRMMKFIGYVKNCRDLGGWACDGGTVRYGRMYRCAAPGAAESADANIAQNANIRYHFDLRDNASLESSPFGSEVYYKRYPLSAYYSDLVDLTKSHYAEMAALLRAVFDVVIHGNGVIYHCSLGRDRTGTLSFILLALLGVSRKHVDMDYELSGFSSLSDAGTPQKRTSANYTGLANYFASFGKSSLRDNVVKWALKAGLTIDELNAYRSAAINGTPAALNASDYVTQYTLTQHLTDCTSNDKDAKTTRQFFRTVQNKMHFAVHRHTAAELIVERADASKEHMGLTTWENAPEGKILKADVTVAKNYLSTEEMRYLERIVSLYLDYAELQAERKIPMSMEDWAKRLDGFLEFNGNQLLTRPGKISAEQAKLHAETEYEKYRIIQDRLYESDFDRFLLLEQEVNRNDQ